MAVGEYAVASDTGRRRRRNEDNYVVAPPLFAVADGMGGAQAGEVASKLAASALVGSEAAELGGPEHVNALIQEANRRVYDRASTDPSASGMGTTMTVALVEGMSVVIGHVGDSRAYLVRGDSMEQLTEDHSLVNELVKSGKLSEEDAQIHPQRSVITRAVGTDPNVDVDAFTIDAEDGDVFLLCSDGLTDMVEDVDILELVDRNRGDLEKAVRALVQFANKEGGEDNITAVAFRIAAVSESESAEPSAEDTMTMPAVSEPDERTPESVEVPPRAEIAPRRVVIVLAALVLLAIVAALLIWGALTLTLRNRELFALLTVGVITAIGFASVYIALKSQISSGSLGYAAFFFALYLVAHVVARVTVPLADPYLLPMAALLTAVGLTEIYRLGPPSALRQGVWVVIGVGAFAATLIWLRRDYRVLERYKYIFGVVAILLLFMPLAPGIGETINGARLWVDVGGLQFQPGELGKIALIVFLAAYLREKREVLAQGRLKDWGPLLVIWGGAMLVLFATNDLGSALLYYGIFLALLYIATARLSFVAAALGLFLVGAFAVGRATPHVHERVTDWLYPWTSNPIYCPSSGTMLVRQQCQSFQLVQSLYGIAHGGWIGTGLGRGIVTTAAGNEIVPDQNTDFIYSAIAQELGLVGAAALLLLYMAFVVRGFQISLAASDGFSKLLAAGLSFGFALQTFVIVGGILRVIPLTGITLPFVSYGGSSVVSNFFLMAGLMLISNRANREHAVAA